jgi:curved DNA-binding protein CbpA
MLERVEGDAYVVLGISRGADDAAIARAHRRLARRHHPDVAGETAGRRMMRINAAYDAIKTAERRAAFEEWIFGASPPAAREGLPKFRTPRFHRTLSGWMNLIIDSGLVIERVNEPYADAELAQREPYVRDTRLVGYFLHVRCRKPTGCGNLTMHRE